MDSQSGELPLDAGAEDSPRPRVLVADDNTGLAEVWCFALADAGYEVSCAGTGAEALSIARRHQCAVAVLDLQLPDVSGLELFMALRAEDPDLEGIIITGHASMESAIEAVNRGVYSYLVKPVAPDMLHLMVERALERQRLSVENKRMVSHLLALQEVLDTALDAIGLDEFLQRMMQAVAKAMGLDDATLFLVDDDGFLTASVMYPPASDADLRLRLRPGEGLAGTIFAEGRPAQVRDTDQSPLILTRRLAEKGIRSVLGVPLAAGGRQIGVLRVGSAKERLFLPREVRLLGDMAQRMALAVEKWRLLEKRERQHRELETAYAREHHIAETLQRSFIPQQLGGVAGVSVGHLYQAALAEAEVGGDFYDLVPLGNDRVAIVMGDVSGKGLAAAVHTALTKYTLRGYALEDPDPGRLMDRLNRAIFQQVGGDSFVTLFYGLLNTRTGHLAYVSAGHEPALIRRAVGAPEWLRSTGPVAGAFPCWEYRSCETHLEMGDLLLLYTDGASDAGHGERTLGMDGLRRLLEEHAGPDPQQTVDGLFSGIRRWATAGLRDDVALLLLRRSAPPCGTRRCNLRATRR